MVPLFLGLFACADPGGRGQKAVSLDSPSPGVPGLTVAWADDVGGRGAQKIRDVAAGSARSFLVGSWVKSVDLHEGHSRTAADAAEHPFVAAVDGAGRPIWLRAFPAAGEMGRAAVTKAEDVVVSGTRAAEENVGCGPIAQPGGFLAKYDGATGLCLWMRVWPSSQSYSISGVKTMPDGDLVVAGSFAGTLDFGNGVVLENANAHPQIFVARLDSRGHGIWSQFLGDVSADGTVVITATDLSVDDAGDISVAGAYQGPARIGNQIADPGPGNTNLYAGSFNPNGLPGGSSFFSATGFVPVVMDMRNGQLALVVPTSDGRGLDVMVAHDGVGPLWTETLLGSATMEPGGVVVDDAGDVNVVGTFTDGDVVVGNSTFVATDASTQRVLSVVLDPSDGAVLAANAWGEDGGRIEDPRISFGKTGQRLMTVDLVGPNHLGSVALGSTDPLDEDGAVLDFTHQSPPGTTPAFQVGWTKAIDGPDDDADDVAAGSTRSFILGDGVSTLSRNRNGGFVAAIDPNGTTLWNRGYVGVRYGSVIATPEDDAVVLGTRSAAEDVGCGPVVAAAGDPGTAFLAKYDGASGLCLWMRVWASSGFLSVDHVANEAAGELVVTGGFIGTVDLGGGNVLVNDATQEQVFVARLSSRGHTIWVRVLGDPSPGSTTDVTGGALATDASGNIYLAGNAQGRTDFDGQIVDLGPSISMAYVVSIDGAGAFRWLYFDHKGDTTPTAIDAGAGRVAVLGRHFSPFVFAGQTLDGRGDLFVIDFDLQGRQRWARDIPASGGFSRAEDLAIDQDGSVAVVGTFESNAQIDQSNTATLQLGRQVFVPYGRADINIRAGEDPIWGFMAVFDAADGQILRANTFGSTAAFIFSPRISFGPTGMKLMSVSFDGMAPFGGETFGKDVHTDQFTGVFMQLNP